MDHSVVYVSSEDGDWCGLYIDGELWDQNHSLNLSDVLESLSKIVGFDFYTYNVKMDPYEFSSLPFELSAIKE